MPYTFNPFIGNFDDQGPLPFGTAANPFPATGFYINDTSGARWLITLDTSGHFVATFAPIGSLQGLLGLGFPLIQ